MGDFLERIRSGSDLIWAAAVWVRAVGVRLGVLGSDGRAAALYRNTDYTE